MDGTSPKREPRTDEELLLLLGEVLERVDPPPSWLVSASERLYDVRDAELAALIADSSVDAAGTAVRSAGTVTPRLLTFEAADFAVEVEVEPASAGSPAGSSSVGHVVRGQVVPRQELRIQLVSRTAGGDLALHRHDEVTTDAHGRFEVDGVPPGPFRLVCRRPGQQPVATAWVVIDQA
jgi:hypothetical protein